MASAVALLALVAGAGAAGRAGTALPRSLSDRPDEQSGPQIHVVYVLPSDGADRAFDTDGTIAASVRNFQTWLAGQTGGHDLRMDTFLGELDISFFRSSQTDAQLAANGPYVRDAVERELHDAGFNAPGKLYAVYYDGTSTYACGGGAWPPVLPGNVGALYLRATYGAGLPCYTPSKSLSGLQIMDLGILHELLHTMGFVPTCAPHNTRGGHVSDSPNDLMYAGDQPWYPTTLDVGHDDYYGAHITGCLDLADSPYLVSDTYPLAIEIDAQGGSGSVTSSPAGISCPGTCSASFASGTLVTLTATPAAASRFVGWDGGCSGAGACRITVDAAVTVKAIFAALQHRVGVAVKGRGRVSSAPVGIACPRRCSALFNAGTRVVLRATPSKGWRWRGWTGACTGRRACPLVLSSDRAVAARFSH